MDKVQPITRRAALLGALVSTAAIALPASTLSAPLDGHTLADLVGEHDRLYAEMIVLFDAEAAAERLYRQTHSPLVPLSLTPKGRSVSGHLELRLYGRQAVADEIRKAHASLVQQHCSGFREEMAPGAHAEMRASLKKSQAKCMRALNAAVREMEAQRESTGYAGAWRAARIASEAEVAACLAVFAYTPRSTAEAVAKVEWIKALLAERHDTSPEPDELEALYGAIAQAVLA